MWFEGNRLRGCTNLFFSIYVSVILIYLDNQYSKYHLYQAVEQQCKYGKAERGYPSVSCMIYDIVCCFISVDKPNQTVPTSLFFFYPTPSHSG